MAVHVADQVQASIDATDSVACVGLDPRVELLPPDVLASAIDDHGPGVDGVAAAFTRFNRGLIEAIAGRCAAVKPQVACYEAYGAPGRQALDDTIAAAVDAGIPVVVDAKRNDIGSTATHYHESFFGGAPTLDGSVTSGSGASWITVNGYLGSDGVQPFLDGGGCGVFVLVKTSNPSSGELQDQPSVDRTIAERMAELVAAWGRDRLGERGLSDVGAVVGATYPAEAQALRRLMPDSLFLVPGYGAQGGDASGALAGVRADGTGVLVNSSRGIVGAWRHGAGGAETDWQGSARTALDAMNDDLRAGRSS